MGHDTYSYISSYLSLVRSFASASKKSSKTLCDDAPTEPRERGESLFQLDGQTVRNTQPKMTFLILDHVVMIIQTPSIPPPICLECSYGSLF